MSILQEVLGLSALVLGIVNGLTLLHHYLKDKPRLVVETVHPDVYQWWFRLPSGEYNGRATRKYGFLAYVGVINRGLRKVSLGSWRLHINTLAGNKYGLRAINIPEPMSKLGDTGNMKLWPVLGTRGLFFPGETLVDSGTSISGMAYYIAEFWGGDTHNPRISSGRIAAQFVVEDAFGRKSSARIVFSEVPLGRAKSLIEDIDRIG